MGIMGFGCDDKDHYGSGQFSKYFDDGALMLGLF